MNYERARGHFALLVGAKKWGDVSFAIALEMVKTALVRR